MNRKPLLDAIRLLLALEVVREHYAHDAGFFPAVALFLGISGFVIPGSWVASRNWGHFLWKRALRLLPALGMSLGLVWLIAGVSGIAGVLAAYATLGIHTSQYNNVVWSLGWEEIYYALLALLFICGGFKKPVLVGLIVAGATVPWLMEGPIILLVARPLAAAFFTGNLCYLFRHKLGDYRFLALGGTLVLGAWYALAAHKIVPYASFPVPGFTTAALVACVLGTGVGFSPRIPKFPDLSYGVYLYHLPLAWLFGRSWQGLGAVLGFALLSAILVEQPFLKLKDLTVQKGPTATPLINVPSSLQIR